MNRSVAFVLVVVLAAVAAGYFVFARRGTAVPPGPGPTAPTSTPPAAAPPTAQTGEAPPAPSPAPAKPVAAGRILFPGGVEMPALNGVTEDVKLNWHGGPWSPVVRKIHDGGLDWYIHEDGSHSTVLMAECQGRMQAFGLVAQPTQPIPTQEEARQQLQAQLQKAGQQAAGK